MSAGFTPGPWYVRDLTAHTMRQLGWAGPSIDRILITNKTGSEIIRDEGEDCVIARIQFDNRHEELSESNLADAHLIAAAPDLYDGCNALLGLIQLLAANPDTPPALLRILTENHRIAEAEAAVAKARREQVPT